MDIANSNGQGQQAVDKLDKWKSCHDIFFSRNALIVHYGQFSWVICMLQSSLQSDCPRSGRCFWQAYNVPWYIASADKMWHQSCLNFSIFLKRWCLHASRRWFRSSSTSLNVSWALSGTTNLRILWPKEFWNVQFALAFHPIQSAYLRMVILNLLRLFHHCGVKILLAHWR